MCDVVTFGEAMVRLSPPHFQRLEQTTSLDVQVGGGELNVAVGVRRLGLTSAWVSRLPKNPLARLMQNRVRQAGVDDSHIVWADSGRLGLYFVEFGAAPRASSVLYDRAHSAISAIKTGEVDWAKVMQGAKWFHTSGITPALSDSAAEATREALVAAKKAGLTVSYDYGRTVRYALPATYAPTRTGVIDDKSFWVYDEHGKIVSIYRRD